MHALQTADSMSVQLCDANCSGQQAAHGSHFVSLTPLQTDTVLCPSRQLLHTSQTRSDVLVGGIASNSNLDVGMLGCVGLRPVTHCESCHPHPAIKEQDATSLASVQTRLASRQAPTPHVGSQTQVGGGV